MAQARFQEYFKNIINFNKKQAAIAIKSGHRPNFVITTISFLILLLNSEIITTQAQEQLSIKQFSPYYYVGCFTERAEVLTDSVYAKMPQTCVEICELKNTTYAILIQEKCYCSNDIVAEDRQDDKLCDIPCVALKSEYCGGVGVHSYYTFNTDASPKDLSLQNASENSLSIVWKPYVPPKMFIAGSETPPVLKITNYLIQIQRLHTYSSKAFFAQPEFVVQGSENKLEITDLLPATTYNITVRSICEGAAGETENCGSAFIVGTTLVAEPSPKPPQPKVLLTTDTTMTIQIKPVRNDNGPVSKILVIVERVDDSLSQPFDTSLLGNWKKADQDGLPYYIAAELDYDRPGDNKTRKFIVGDGKRYGRYTNPPLNNKEADYHVSLGVVSLQLF